MQSNSASNRNSKQPRQPMRNRKPKAIRIQLALPQGLLKIVDEAAEHDYTTRSDIIRTALLWYLRPQGRDFNQVEPDEILKTLQHRKMQVGVREMTKDINIFND